jgi:septal ring factor EnvC (AmiA/AmiB activator)
MPYFLLTLIVSLYSSPSFAEKGLETTLESVEAQLVEINESIQDVNTKVESTELRLHEKQQQENVLRKKLVTQLDTFNGTLKDILRIQRLPQEALIIMDGLQGHSKRKNILEKGQKNLQTKINADKEALSSLLTNLTAQETILNDLNELKETLERKKVGFNKLRKIQVKLLQPDEIEKEALILKAKELEKSLSLAGLFGTKSVIKKRSQVNITYPNMPVDGDVVSIYNQKDEKGIHAQGITILSTPSTPVKALKDGHIIYSNIFREYGYLVILEHSDGYHTLYSGLNGGSKEIGDFISAGGTIGMLPAIEKPTLYLEVRKDGETVDPKKLLKIANKN